MKKILKFIFIAFLLFSAQEAFAADRYWVGGGASTNWNATGNTNWAASSGGANNASVPTTNDNVFIDANCGGGTVTVNTGTAVLDSFDMTGSVCTLAGTNTINVDGAAGVTKKVLFSGTVTWTGTLVLSNNSTNLVSLTTNGALMTSVTIGGSATTTLQDNLSFTAIKTSVLTMGTGQSTKLDMNGFTISGNSATNRLLVTSGTLGTQRTITRSGGAFANVDFRDIDLEAAYDCSAITGLCGDAGGNSADLTFTTAQTNYWVGNGGNWSDVNEWASSSGGSAGTGRVALPQDTCIFDANSISSGSQTVVLDTPRTCLNWDYSAVTNTPTFQSSSAIQQTVYGSLSLGNVTYTSSSGTVTLNMVSRTPVTLTSNGNTWTTWRLAQNLIGSGKITLQDAFASTGAYLGNSGELDTNDFSFTSSNNLNWNSTSVRVLTLGNSTVTLSGTGNPMDIDGANMTMNAETSTIVFSNTTGTAKTFTTNAKTFNNVTFAADNITIAGSATFAGELAVDTAGLSTGLIIGSGTTQTLTGTLTTNGFASNLAKLSGVAGGGAETLSKASGTVCVEYMNITNITASGGASFYAANSTDGTGNSGWTFSACPGGSTVVPDYKRKMLGI